MSDVPLSDYISQVITEINLGIMKAIDSAQESKDLYKINPMPSGAEKNWKPFERQIEFDIAVTASRKSDTNLDVGVSQIFTAKFMFGRAKDESSVNRVRFSIPVVFSGQPIEGAIASLLIRLLEVTLFAWAAAGRIFGSRRQRGRPL